MRYTNIFPNPEDEGFLRFTVDTNPDQHHGYSENINFDPEEHIQQFSGKWDLKDGEIIVRFVDLREGRTNTVARYQEEDFSCKIDDTDTEQGDYHIEVNGSRVEENIKNDEKLHPASFCLLRLLEELEERKNEYLPIYFFFGREVERDLKIKRLIVGRKPKKVNLTRYCFALVHSIEKGRKLNLNQIEDWRENILLPALEEVNKTIKEKGGIKIPWSNEKRAFPVPITSIGGDKVILESLGNEDPEIPEFLSTFKQESD